MAFIEPARTVMVTRPATSPTPRPAPLGGVATLVSRRVFDAASASRKVGSLELRRSGMLHGYFLRVDLFFGELGAAEARARARAAPSPLGCPLVHFRSLFLCLLSRFVSFRFVSSGLPAAGASS